MSTQCSEKAIDTSHPVMRRSSTICVSFVNRSDMEKMKTKPIFLLGRDPSIPITTDSSGCTAGNSVRVWAFFYQAHPDLRALCVFAHRPHDVCSHLGAIMYLAYTIVKSGLPSMYREHNLVSKTDSKGSKRGMQNDLDDSQSRR